MLHGKHSVRLLIVVLFLSAFAFAQWVPLGPDGGDVRRLTYDPGNPDRVFLGTSAGQLFLSSDGGASWSRYAHLGTGNDYVLDDMAIDPQHPSTMYVAAWSIENQGGDLFCSHDGGKTWKVLPGMSGKSIRAFAMAHSDSRVLVAGALDGVFRSLDGGDTWQLISPPHHAEIKNIESVAIDPRNPDVIYAGTWHLAWKTNDGGRNWHSIKNGVVDDSDVFSIIVDTTNASNVYLSACSGIYKSENGGELFHKIQGIPFSARRTRVLQQDPSQPAVVYAGTTEGLWKTVDAGKTWKRVTPPNIIVNDVLVDPRRSARVLLATDRSGVLASNDAGLDFRPSNRGFAHRQVSAVIADRFSRDILFAGLVNDKEFGGVLMTRNSGAEWTQVNSGLDGRDVFSLTQSSAGKLIAGTNRGIFELDSGSGVWRPINTVLTAKTLPLRATTVKGRKAATPPAPGVEWSKSELTARVAQVLLTPDKWYTATSAGLYQSGDSGKSWQGGPLLGETNLVAVQMLGQVAMAATSGSVLVSGDAGASWSRAKLPHYVTAVYNVAVAPGALWVATREGALRSPDMGATWEHVLGGLPARNIGFIFYDAGGRRLLATAFSGEMFQSSNGGGTWQREDSGWRIRTLTSAPGRLLAITAFDGILMQPESEAKSANADGPEAGSSRSAR